jgi:hypothetical protein
MLIYVLLACKNAQIDHNKHHTPSPSICKNDEEEQSSYFDGTWSQFPLPSNTNLVYAFPHPKGLLFSVHTVHAYSEREMNHSYLYWWGEECGGLEAQTSVQNCSSSIFEQSCLIDSNSEIFAHIMFLEQNSTSLDHIRVSDTSFQIQDVSYPITQIKDHHSMMFFQDRENIYDENNSPLLPTNTHRFITDFQPTLESLIISQIKPEPQLQFWSFHSELLDFISLPNPLGANHWSLWGSYLLYIQQNTNILHVSHEDSFSSVQQIELSSNPIQICSNSSIWMLLADDVLKNFEIDPLTNILIEKASFSLYSDVQDHQLFCSDKEIYLFDIPNHVLHRKNVD